MGLFRIFLEENARLKLDLVNFFFTSNSLLHIFFPGIAWSRSSDSFEVNGCILVTLIFLSLTYFVKTIDIFTLVGRSFEHSFFISFDTINMWNIYKIFSGANVLEFQIDTVIFKCIT